MSRQSTRFWRFLAVAAVVLTLLAAVIVVYRPHPQRPRLGPRGGASTARTSAATRPIVATLYFARVTDDKIRLAPVTRRLPPGVSVATVAVAELVRGKVPPGCQRPLPPDTRLLGVTVEGDLARADFSSELVGRFSGGSDNEEAVVYAIVNTLASLPGIRRVSILVEGRQIETIGGHLDVSSPLTPDAELVAHQP
jgi:germination protein M